MESEGSLPLSQGPSTYPFPEHNILGIKVKVVTCKNNKSTIQIPTLVPRIKEANFKKQKIC
jgi:hypothetical protein